MDRPKLEIIRTDAGVSFHLDGKCLDETTPERNACDAAESIAKELARALGADVVDADEPTRQPYTYFVTFTATERVTWRQPWKALVHSGTLQAGAWFRLDKDIEGPADTRALADRIAEQYDDPMIVIITGFTYVDGPS